MIRADVKGWIRGNLTPGLHWQRVPNSVCPRHLRGRALRFARPIILAGFVYGPSYPNGQNAACELSSEQTSVVGCRMPEMSGHRCRPGHILDV